MVDLIRRLLISGLWMMTNKVNPNDVKCPTCDYWCEIDKKLKEEMGFPEQKGFCFFNPPSFQGFGLSDRRGWCRHHTQLPKEKEE